jgi:ketosteroid isomerase-like protein
MNPHTATVRSLYEAFARGDVPTVLGALAPDVRWTEAEGFPYGGTYSGPQAVLENVFMKLGGEWEGFAAVPRELVSEGETVVAIGMYSGKFKATGKSMKAPYVHVWKFKGGKIQTFEQHTDTVLVQRALK